VPNPDYDSGILLLDNSRGVADDDNNWRFNRVSGPDQLPDKSENLAKAEDRRASLGEQLSRLVEWIKPYKEITALLVGLFSAISVGISWTVSHFATRTALSELECRISHDNGTKGLADAAAATAAAVGLRHAQMRDIAVQPPTSASAALINQLSVEADAIAGEAATKAAEAAQKINENFAACERAISSGKSETQP
jgi:hypothetical protein